jgi:hypothetical protein
LIFVFNQNIQAIWDGGNNSLQSKKTTHVEKKRLCLLPQVF